MIKCLYNGKIAKYGGLVEFPYCGGSKLKPAHLVVLPDGKIELCATDKNIVISPNKSGLLARALGIPACDCGDGEYCGVCHA